MSVVKKCQQGAIQNSSEEVQRKIWGNSESLLKSSSQTSSSSTSSPSTSLLTKQRLHVFCRGGAHSKNVPGTPWVTAGEHHCLLHGEEGNCLLQKIWSWDSILQVFFKGQLQFLHFAEAFPFQTVEFTPGELDVVLRSDVQGVGRHVWCWGEVFSWFQN